MKTAKMVITVLLCIILLVAETAALGLFAMDRALSRGTVKDAVHETGFAVKLTDEVLSSTTVNMGGRYGEMAEAVMKTEAMEDFFADYIDNAVKHEIYGDEYSEVSTDELMAAFNQGLKQAEKSGNVMLTDNEKDLVKQTMLKQAPDMTSGLNDLIGSYDSTEGDMVETAADPYSGFAAASSSGSRVLAWAVCAVVCILLIVILWRSKLGFIWCGVVTAITTLIYLGLGTAAGGLFMGMVSDTPADEMLLYMISSGFGAAAIFGGIAAVIFFIAYFVLRIKHRRNTNESNTAPAERTA